MSAEGSWSSGTNSPSEGRLPGFIRLLAGALAVTLSQWSRSDGACRPSVPCGVLCLQEICRARGFLREAEAVHRVGSDMGADATTLGGLARLARLCALPARLAVLDRRGLLELLDKGYGAVLHLEKDEHFVAAVSRRGEEIMIFDGIAYVRASRELPALWDGGVLVVCFGEGGAGESDLSLCGVASMSALLFLFGGAFLGVICLLLLRRAITNRKGGRVTCAP